MKSWAGNSTRNLLLSLAAHVVLFLILFFSLSRETSFDAKRAGVSVRISVPGDSKGQVATAPRKPKPAPKFVPLKPARPQQAQPLAQPADQSSTQPSDQVTAGGTTTGPGSPNGSPNGTAEGLPDPTAEFMVTQMPVLLTDVRVAYPSAAKGRGVQGPVEMDLLIDSVGAVRDVRLIQSLDPDLDRAAMDAARKFRFQPALVEKDPVAVKIRYVYRFILER